MERSAAAGGGAEVVVAVGFRARLGSGSEEVTDGKNVIDQANSRQRGCGDGRKRVEM